MKEFRFSWVISKWTVDLFNRDLMFGRSNSAERLWNPAALAVTWALWLERNDRIFDDLVGDVSEVWDRIKY